MSVLCNECSSDMVFRDGLWQCDNCFNVLILEDIGFAPIEDGLTMDEVMKQYEDK
jgi:ribosomal protein L37AE/L43A